MQTDAPLTQERRLSSEGTARQQHYFKDLLKAARDKSDGAWDRLKMIRGAIWARFHDGHLTEEQTQYLATIVENRLKPAEKPPAKARPAESYVGTRPIGDDSLPRRRRLSRETFVHPQETGDLTNGEMAVLTVITEEITQHGRCELPMGKMAALGGVSVRWAQHTVAKLVALCFILVEYRPRERRRHDTNVITLHPSRQALKARLRRVKSWWRGRGALWATGRSLVHATRLKKNNRHPLSGDNSVHGAPSAPDRLGGRWIARPAPS